MSRADSVGMFWEDVEVPKPERKGAEPRGPRVLPPTPETGWEPPREFPRIESAECIVIDCETYDPELDDAGPGWGRGPGKGHIVGLAVGVPGPDGGKWYFPMRHEVGSEMNMNPDNVLAWARDTFGNPRVPKYFANAMYDLGWLDQEGVEVQGDICDVQIAEPMLDEYAYTYELDALAHKYLKYGKPQDAMIEWMLNAYGGSRKRIKGNIYRTHPRLVGPYAEGDVVLPPLVFHEQRKELEAQDLWDLYLLEAKLPRILMAMRKRGVRVDIAGAQRVAERLTERAKAIEVGELAGINPNSPGDLMRYATKLGVTPPRTENDNPSFAGKWLAKNMPAVAELRQLLKMRDTFVNSYVLDKSIAERLHCMFNQLRSDTFGTVSGRFSSSNPNLQNIPARDEEFGPMMRSLYLPDVGHVRWRRFDWSQIEYRFLIHFAYAIGARGADIARAMYLTDPRTDFHVMARS
jgi:DNA polymerase-1